MGNYCCRTVVACGIAPRKRIVAFLIMLIAAIFTIAIWHSANAQMDRELHLQSLLVEMREHVFFLETLYTARHEEVINLKNRVKLPEPKTMIPSELTMLVKNTTENRESSGLLTSNLHMQTAFIYQLLPHLMDDPNSLRPSYHFKSIKKTFTYVLGIPTVKRDKENYLILTLDSLIKGMKDDDFEKTLIVVYVGDINLDYVLTVVRDISDKFPSAIDNGLIEVIAPPASYYPEISRLTPNLGDSRKRFYWRTKQNLDTLFLMAYVRTKAPYYLMLEDDVIATDTYMQEIKRFTSTISVTNPNWFFIEYCPIGGIGKLFRSSDLIHFITYVQLFYDKFPIDWLLDKYLASRICTLDQTSKSCVSSKLKIRPKYKGNLFKHIGLYSSLKGKIHSSKSKQNIANYKEFHPHHNPSAEAVTTIQHYKDHSLIRAYKGLDFFWGIKPKKNNTITFIFREPMVIERYLFRSGNPDYVLDKIIYSVVEVLPEDTKKFIEVGNFDEFGLAEGTIKKKYGPLDAIQLRITKDHSNWVILSEIELVAVRNGNETGYSAQDTFFESSQLEMLSDSQQMCNEVALEAHFEPEIVVGKPWRVHHMWNMNIKNECVDMQFVVATPKIIRQLYRDMSMYLSAQPTWDTASLLLTVGQGKREILLFKDQGPAGRFLGVPNMARDESITVRKGELPLIKFQMKLLKGGRLLLVADCMTGWASLAGRHDDNFTRKDIAEAAKALTLVYGTGQAQGCEADVRKNIMVDDLVMV